MPELIHRPNSFQPIPAVRKHPQIPRQRCRIAADVDDSLRPDLQDRFQTPGITSLSGRIHTDDIDAGVLLVRSLLQDIFRQYFLCLSHKKLRVFYAVPACVLPGIFDRFGNDLNAADFSCTAGHEQ